MGKKGRGRHDACGQPWEQHEIVRSPRALVWACPQFTQTVAEAVIGKRQ